MKQLKITIPEYIQLEHNYRRWLQALGYSEDVTQDFPIHIREFLHYLEQHQIPNLQDTTSQTLTHYYKHLSQRKNTTRDGALSSGTLNNHINALKRLADYLHREQQTLLPIETLTLEKPNYQPIIPLTTAEVQTLYMATETYEKESPNKAMRDRAILALLYDCGLRRSEAIRLTIQDIDKDNRTLQVHHGKNNKSRIIPFSSNTAVHLLDYQHLARPELLKDSITEIYLLNRDGNPCSVELPDRRLKVLQQHLPNIPLKTKRLHPHLLRHSIATHLLQAGMNLEKVSQLLGHSSLDITQHYTHLAATYSTPNTQDHE